MDQVQLLEKLRALAQKRPKCGYRMLCTMLRRQGLRVNPKRIYRLYRLEGLSLSKKKGKKRRYVGVGWHLTHNLSSIVDGDTAEEMQERLDELSELLREEQEDERDRIVLAWFAREFPRVMDLVPTRRRSQFLKGVYECNEGEEPLS